MPVPDHVHLAAQSGRPGHAAYLGEHLQAAFVLADEEHVRIGYGIRCDERRIGAVDLSGKHETVAGGIVPVEREDTVPGPSQPHGIRRPTHRAATKTARRIPQKDRHVVRRDELAQDDEVLEILYIEKQHLVVGADARKPLDVRAGEQSGGMSSAQRKGFAQPPQPGKGNADGAPTMDRYLGAVRKFRFRQQIFGQEIIAP